MDSSSAISENSTGLPALAPVALLERLMESSSDPVLRLDSRRHLLAANPAAQRRFGPLSLVAGAELALAEWVVDADQSTVVALLDECSSTQSAGELLIRGRDAWSGEWKLIVEPWPSSQSDEGGSLLILRELRLESQTSQRWQRLNSLWSMAGGIAHVFNNQLTTALGNIFRLRARIGRDAEVLAPLEQMETALLAMDRLTGELLRFTGTGDLSLVPLQLESWLIDRLGAMQRALPKDIVVKLIAAPGGALVKADPVALEQCLGAIVQNACDALAGRGHIELELEQVSVTWVRQLEPRWMEPSAPAYAVLRVRDDGPGIDPALLEQAVEPFVTSRQPGRGLGLAVALGIAHGHRGGLHIAALPGGGTQVEVFLPLLDGLAGPHAGLSYGS